MVVKLVFVLVVFQILFFRRLLCRVSSWIESLLQCLRVTSAMFSRDNAFAAWFLALAQWIILKWNSKKHSRQWASFPVTSVMVSSHLSTSQSFLTTNSLLSLYNRSRRVANRTERHCYVLSLASFLGQQGLLTSILFVVWSFPAVLANKRRLAACCTLWHWLLSARSLAAGQVPLDF